MALLTEGGSASALAAINMAFLTEGERTFMISGQFVQTCQTLATLISLLLAS
jgi:hypothetical protein